MTTKVPARMLDADVPSVASLATMMNALLPVGSLVPFSGSAAPANVTIFGVTVEFALCYGQAVSRTTYSTLFGRLGTAHGAGDGSTTFNLPDYRGRIILGKDDMGGSAANRVTNAISGIAATTLGAVGGDQRLHQHTHGVTDAGHSHAFDTYETESSGSGAASGTGTQGLDGITDSTTTGITIDNAGAGSSQNMPPVQVANVLIRLR